MLIGWMPLAVLAPLFDPQPWSAELAQPVAARLVRDRSTTCSSPARSRTGRGSRSRARCRSPCRRCRRCRCRSSACSPASCCSASDPGRRNGSRSALVVAALFTVLFQPAGGGHRGAARAGRLTQAMRRSGRCRNGLSELGDQRQHAASANQASRFALHRSPIACRVSRVALPTCGSSTTLSIASSAAGTFGSSANTSRPAPLIVPSASARPSAGLVDDRAARDVDQRALRCRAPRARRHRRDGASPGRRDTRRPGSRRRPRATRGRRRYRYGTSCGLRPVYATRIPIAATRSAIALPMRPSPRMPTRSPAELRRELRARAAAIRRACTKRFARDEAAPGHQDQRDGDVGDVVGQHVGRVRHLDAALPAVVGGHAVVADAEHRDDLELRQRVEQRRSASRFRRPAPVRGSSRRLRASSAGLSRACA